MVHRHGGVCMNREPTLLVLITGAAGTGKSTVADLLSHRWSTSHLDFDTVTRPIVDRALREHPEWDEPTCLREVKDQRYAAFFESIETELTSGDTRKILVASAPITGYLADPEAWGAVQVGLRRAGGEPVVIWLHVNEETRQARVAKRGSVRDLGVSEAQRTPVSPQIAHIPVTAEVSPEAVVEEISGALQKIFGKP